MCPAGDSDGTALGQEIKREVKKFYGDEIGPRFDAEVGLGWVGLDGFLESHSPR